MLPTAIGHKPVRLANEIRFEVEGKPYVYQGLSGVVIRLDGLSAAVLDVLKDHKPQSAEQIVQKLNGAFDPDEIGVAIRELVGMEVLTEDGAVRRNSRTPGLPDWRELPLQTLVLHLVNECNLNCTYCYAGGGDYGKPMKTMNPATARRAIDFLLKESGGSQRISVVLFGGEPLLNWSVLKETVEYGTKAAAKAGKEIDFSLTTNGTLLNEERIRFLAVHRVGVSVSLDGPQEVHDKWRLFNGGGGSYEIVSRNAEKLIQLHTTRPIAARVTLTREFKPIRELMDHLLNMGFHEVGFAPVSGTDEDLLLGNPELFRLLDDFERCADDFVEAALEDRYLGFSNLVNILVDLHTGVNKGFGCGAGLGFMAVSPSGDLFLCHRFNEQQDYRLGDIYSGIDRQFRTDLMTSLHVDNKTTCSSCALKHTCTGGCYYEAKERMGEITSPNLHYCNWMKRWYTIGLKTYVRILEKNPGFIDRVAGTVSNCQTN